MLEICPSLAVSALPSGAPGTPYAESFEGGAQQRRRIEAPAVGVSAELVQHAASLGFAKAEVAKRREDLGIRVQRVRVEGATEAAAVSTEKAEPARRAPLDEQLTRMRRPVMDATQRDDVLVHVGASLGARYEVVQVEVEGIAATGHATDVAVAVQHAAANRRRHALGRPMVCPLVCPSTRGRGRPHVGIGGLTRCGP